MQEYGENSQFDRERRVFIVGELTAEMLDLDGSSALAEEVRNETVNATQRIQQGVSHVDDDD